MKDKERRNFFINNIRNNYYNIISVQYPATLCAVVGGLERRDVYTYIRRILISI